jgi:hypothetical protein
MLLQLAVAMLAGLAFLALGRREAMSALQVRRSWRWVPRCCRRALSAG